MTVSYYAVNKEREMEGFAENSFEARQILRKNGFKHTEWTIVEV